MSLRQRIEKLEKEVEELKKNRGGSRMQEVADWILKKFEDKDIYTTRRLFELALKERGWKYQTLQIARRHMLEDKIGIEHKKGKGWCWIDMRSL